MTLRGVRVLELAGLAPAPFCGMILADHGASVTRVDRPNAPPVDRLGRGKRSIVMDLKRNEGRAAFQKLSKNFDVLVEPFRKGVMESLQLGPATLMQSNPRLVYVRLSGYGHSGPLAPHAGHDINYLAISGVLSACGDQEKPRPPVNLVADFAGGGLMAAMGTMLALYEREKTGKGQVVDAAMTDGSAYLASWLWRSRDLPQVWGKERGFNVLDGGSPQYDTYKTADGKWIAIGPLEPQFLAALEEKSGVQVGDELRDWVAARTFKDLTALFESSECCTSPVLSLDEAAEHPHNVARGTFLAGSRGWEPAPAPRLSGATHMTEAPPDPEIGEHSSEVLLENNFSQTEVDELLKLKVVQQLRSSSKL